MNTKVFCKYGLLVVFLMQVFLKHWGARLRLWPSAHRTIHTHHWFKNYAAKHRLSTQQTSVNHYKFQSSTALYSLMMDRIRSETCRSDF